MSANLTIYCLEKITDYFGFERLCNDLMVLEGYPNLESLGGSKDKGRDALHISKLDGVTIFAYSVREDWLPKLFEDAGKIYKHNHLCHKLIFITTAQPTAGERDHAIANIRHRYGWELEIYGHERLRILLDIKHSKLKKKHPGIFPPEILAAQEAIEKLEDCKQILISYAPEDFVLAEWLAQRLTAEGYSVWCENLKSLSEESFPDDIEQAIREQISCLVVLCSRSSVLNPDLVLQRSLGFSIEKQRKRKFLVLIDVDKIDRQKLDQKTRASQFVAFSSNWAEGLSSLLEQLISMNCPRILLDGPRVAIKTLLNQDVLLDQTETIVSNHLRIESMPQTIYRFESPRALSNEEVEDFKFDWACKKVDSKFLLAFHEPPDIIKQQLNLRHAGSALWVSMPRINGVLSKHIVSELLKKSFFVKCCQKGLKYSPETRLQYFPEGLQEGLTESGRLRLIKIDGSTSFVQAWGTRTYKKALVSEKYKYYLAPVFYISQNIIDDFSIIVRVKIHLSDLNGSSLPKSKRLSRRKHLCNGWWNDDWLNRTLAICQFLADGDRIVIGEQQNQQLLIHSTPFSLTAPVSIDANAMKQLKQNRAELLAMLDGQREDLEDSDRKALDVNQEGGDRNE